MPFQMPEAVWRSSSLYSSNPATVIADRYADKSERRAGQTAEDDLGNAVKLGVYVT